MSLDEFLKRFLVAEPNFWIVITYFPIDLTSNGIPFGAKSIGKV